MCLAFIAEKMSKSARIERRRLTRIKRRAKEREDLFALDYIRHKYPAVYNEAAQICQQLNHKYPDKADLRKTAEHRLWKSHNPEQTVFALNQPTPIPQNVQITVTCLPTGLQETAEIQSEPSTNPSPYSEPATNQHPPSSPKSNPNSPTMSEPPRITRLPLNDNMELRIPLLKAPMKQSSITTETNTVHHSTVTTETLQIITEEIIQEDTTFQNLDEIDSELIEKIINELQTDPDLRDTFDDIDFQELGMDLDIPEDMFEKELENCQFW